MPYTRISFEHRIIIVTLKEEGMSLRKIRRYYARKAWCRRHNPKDTEKLSKI